MIEKPHMHIYYQKDIDSALLDQITEILDEAYGYVDKDYTELSEEENLKQELTKLFIQQKDTLHVVIAKKNIYLALSTLSLKNLVVLHEKDVPFLYAKVKEGFARMGIILEDPEEEMLLTLTDIEEFAQQETEEPVKEVKKKLKKVVVDKKKKRKKHKHIAAARRRKVRGTWIWSGYYASKVIGLKILTQGNETLDNPLMNIEFKTLKKKLIQDKITQVWLTPLYDTKSWFVVTWAEEDRTAGAILLKQEPVYPLYAYYILQWQPDNPSTVLIGDMNYIVGITKWGDTLLDLKIAPVNTTDTEDVHMGLNYMLNNLERVGIPKLYVPTSSIRKHTADSMASTYQIYEEAVKSEPEVSLEQLDVDTQLPPPQGIPQFRDIGRFNMWDVIFDKDYLKHMKKAVALISGALILTGTSMGVAQGLQSRILTIENASQYLAQQEQKLSQAEISVNNLKKYNMIAQEQKNYPQYLATLTGLFGDRLISLSYNPGRNTFSGTFILGGNVTSKTIQMKLFNYGLAKEIYISSINENANRVTLTWKAELGKGE